MLLVNPLPSRRILNFKNQNLCPCRIRRRVRLWWNDAPQLKRHLCAIERVNRALSTNERSHDEKEYLSAARIEHLSRVNSRLGPSRTQHNNNNNISQPKCARSVSALCIQHNIQIWGQTRQKPRGHITFLYCIFLSRRLFSITRLLLLTDCPASEWVSGRILCALALIHSVCCVQRSNSQSGTVFIAAHSAESDSPHSSSCDLWCGIFLVCSTNLLPKSGQAPEKYCVHGIKNLILQQTVLVRLTSSTRWKILNFLSSERKTLEFIRLEIIVKYYSLE